MDFGDTDHICSSIKLFYSYQHITPINIRLPNGMEMEKCFGTIIFFTRFHNA